MKAGQITAKLRDAVPVCFYSNGSEATRYKNLDIPDILKELEIIGFGFNVPKDGKITFRLHFAEGILPEKFPPEREKLTRAEKAALKATKGAEAEVGIKSEEATETEKTANAEPEEPAAEDEPQTPAIHFNVKGDRRKALAKTVENYTGYGMGVLWPPQLRI